MLRPKWTSNNQSRGSVSSPWFSDVGPLTQILDPQCLPSGHWKPFSRSELCSRGFDHCQGSANQAVPNETRWISINCSLRRHHARTVTQGWGMFSVHSSWVARLCPEPGVRHKVEPNFFMFVGRLKWTFYPDDRTIGTTFFFVPSKTLKELIWMNSQCNEMLDRQPSQINRRWTKAKQKRW